jgi:hypothetical protein
MKAEGRILSAKFGTCCLDSCSKGLPALYLFGFSLIITGFNAFNNMNSVKFISFYLLKIFTKNIY